MVLAALIGPPNSGKSLMFCALTGQQSGDSPVPFSTDRVYVAPGVPALGEITIMDTPSVARHSHRGEWLGLIGFEAARRASALVMAIKCFQTGAGPLEYPGCTGDPLEDLQIVEREMLIADLIAIEARRNEMKPSDPAREAATAIHDAISGGQPARDMGIPGSELEDLLGVSLITAKPVVYALNTDEVTAYEPDRLGSEEVLAQRLDFRGAPVVSFCARLHADAALLGEGPGREMLAELGVDKDAAREVAYAICTALENAR